MTDDAVKAYLCGLFDGEGTICARKNGQQWSVGVQLGMTVEEPIRLLQKTWGGRAYESASNRNTINGYTMWEWRLSAGSEMVHSSSTRRSTRL